MKNNWWFLTPIILFAFFTQVAEQWGYDLLEVYVQFLLPEPISNWHSPIGRYIGEFLYNITGSVRSYYIINTFFIFVGFSLILQALFKKGYSKSITLLIITFFPTTFKLLLYFSKEQAALSALLIVIGLILMYVKKYRNKNLLYAALPFLFYIYAIRSYLIFGVLSLGFFIFYLIEKKTKHTKITRGHKKRILIKGSVLFLVIFSFSTLINLSKISNVDYSNNRSHVNHRRSVYIWELLSISKYKGEQLVPNHWVKDDYKTTPIDMYLSYVGYEDNINSILLLDTSSDFMHPDKINLKETLGVLFAGDNFFYYLKHRFYMISQMLYSPFTLSNNTLRYTIDYDKLHESHRREDTVFYIYKPLIPHFKIMQYAGDKIQNHIIWFVLTLILIVVIYCREGRFARLTDEERNLLLLILIGFNLFSIFFLFIFSPAAVWRYTSIQTMLSQFPILYLLSLNNSGKNIEEET